MAQSSDQGEQAVTHAVAQLALLYERIGYVSARSVTHTVSQEGLEQAMREAHAARAQLLQLARDWAARSYEAGVEEGRASTRVGR